MKVAGSNLHRIFRMTLRCLLVQYSVGPLIIYNGLWLSGLSCLLLLQNYLPMLYGCRFESCQWLCSVYTNKKLSHPSSLSCVLSVAPTMVRSAVQPKTTRLCSSIRVISPWWGPSKNCKDYRAGTFSHFQAPSFIQTWSLTN